MYVFSLRSSSFTNLYKLKINKTLRLHQNALDRKSLALSLVIRRLLLLLHESLWVKGLRRAGDLVFCAGNDLGQFHGGIICFGFHQAVGRNFLRYPNIALAVLCAVMFASESAGGTVMDSLPKSSPSFLTSVGGCA